MEDVYVAAESRENPVKSGIVATNTVPEVYKGVRVLCDLYSAENGRYGVDMGVTFSFWTSPHAGKSISTPALLEKARVFRPTHRAVPAMKKHFR